MQAEPVHARARRRPSLAVAVCAALLAATAACSTTPLRSPARARAPLDGALAERLEVPSLELVSRASPERDGPVVVHAGTVRISGDEHVYRYYLPAEAVGPVPFLLVLPILAGGESITEQVCRALARRGIAAGTIERRWRLFKERETIEELEEKLLAVVRQQRAFLAWIGEQEGVDGRSLGCFGLSVGGMLATLLAAVEPRVDCAVVCLAGGDFARLALEADEIKLERWVSQRCADDGITRHELQSQIRARFSADPLTFAPAVDPARVLFVSARYDGVVPRRSREALWRALGEPQRIDVPLGHYTTVIALEWVVSRAATFAHGRFAPGERAPVALARGD